MKKGRIKMKIALVAGGVLLLTIATAGARCGALGCYGTGSNPNYHYVRPHVNSNGTYTRGYYQTNRNSTQYDNYGTRGNYNPHTGKVGTLDPDH
jgi:hypothetical protein